MSWVQRILANRSLFRIAHKWFAFFSTVLANHVATHLCVNGLISTIANNENYNSEKSYSKKVGRIKWKMESEASLYSGVNETDSEFFRKSNRSVRFLKIPIDFLRCSRSMLSNEVTHSIDLKSIFLLKLNWWHLVQYMHKYVCNDPCGKCEFLEQNEKTGIKWKQISKLIIGNRKICTISRKHCISFKFYCFCAIENAEMQIQLAK